jgi:hypothetical protein
MAGCDAATQMAEEVSIQIVDDTVEIREPILSALQRTVRDLATLERDLGDAIRPVARDREDPIETVRRLVDQAMNRDQNLANAFCAGISDGSAI